MRSAILIAIVLLLSLYAYAADEDSVHFGRFGAVHLYRPAAITSVALFVSGDGGWNLGVIDMARMLADDGALVIGVDIRHFLKQLAADSAKCVYPASDFEQLSQFVQLHLGLTEYTIPVLVGYSSGATLVYAVLAQAPGNTFAGALSLGFCPDLEFPRPFCKGEGLAATPLANGKGYNFLPAPKLFEPWIVLEGAIDQVCDPAATVAFVAQVPKGRLIALEHVGHGYSVPKNWEPQFHDAYQSLSARSVSADPVSAAADTAPDAPADLSSLPLIENPAPGDPARTVVILLSGDGGWSSFDQGVATSFVGKGIGVVGFNSLKYFWHERTPENVAADIARIARHYFAAWQADSLILVGYSFGADVIPHILARLPADVTARVALSVLLSPSHQADFQFHVTGWLGMGNRSSLPVLPELEKLRGQRLLAFYGEDEKETLCSDAPPDLLKCIQLKGGHHFDRDYASLVSQIMHELP